VATFAVEPNVLTAPSKNRRIEGDSRHISLNRAFARSASLYLVRLREHRARRAGSRVWRACLWLVADGRFDLL